MMIKSEKRKSGHTLFVDDGKRDFALNPTRLALSVMRAGVNVLIEGR